jgi:hypothetical protein
MSACSGGGTAVRDKTAPRTEMTASSGADYKALRLHSSAMLLLWRDIAVSCVAQPRHRAVSPPRNGMR